MTMPTEDTICEICGAAATIQLVDTQCETEPLYCSNHELDLPIGERSPRLFIKRYRMPPNSECSRRLAAAKDSPEHQALRYDMCETQLLGGDGACRYYLSIISGTDRFSLWNDEFVRNVKEYVVSRTCDAASKFFDGGHSISCVVDFLRRDCERAEGTDNDRRVTKREIAIEMLLKHPDWSDATIAARVPTTTKQLARWTDFNYLRAVPRRRRAT